MQKEQIDRATNNNEINSERMAAKDFIVAIELGSSKMTGIAGKKNLDGSISVLAVVKEDSSSFIRKGIVYNINQTVQCISNIVKKLSTALKAEIAQVYVGVGGQSIRSVKNVIVKDLPGGAIVSQDMVNELMDINRNMSYLDKEILDALCSSEFRCRGVMHCFSSDTRLMKAALDKGLFISFAGNVTYKSNEMIREAAKAVPIDRILYETDSPYLAPIPMRGKPSNPTFTEYTLEFLADLRNEDKDNLKMHVRDNLFRMLGRDNSVFGPRIS